MLLGNGRNNDGGMKSDKGFAQGIEIRVPSRHLDISCANAIFNVVSMHALAGIDDEDLKVWTLVEDLLYSSVIASFSGQLTGLLLFAVFSFVVVAKVGLSLGEVGMGRRECGW